MKMGRRDSMVRCRAVYQDDLCWYGYGYAAALSVLLLSVIPEKKERYLLPSLVPLALLTACYLRCLMETLPQGRGNKWDKRIVAGSTGAILLAAAAFPVAAFFLAYSPGLISLAQQLGLTAGSYLLAYAIFTAALRRNVALYLLAVLLLNSFVLVLGFPLYERVLHPAGNYKSLLSVREKNELGNLAFYAVDGLPIVHIWEAGKQVDTLRIENQRLQLPANLPAAVFSRTPLTQSNLPDSSVSIKEVEPFRAGRNNPEVVYYVYVLSAVAKAR